MKDCVFCKIISGEISSKFEYEDENMIIIKDINPQARIHLLLIPKKHFSNLMDITEEQTEIVAQCLKKLSHIYLDLGLDRGFRIVCNSGFNACQSIYHLHIHILGGELLSDKMA